MSSITESEARLLAEVSEERLFQDTAAIAQWERLSGTPGAEAGVSYFREQLEKIGIETYYHAIDSLVGWPESAELQVRGAESRSFHAIVAGFTPSTAPEGIEAEVVYVGVGDDAEFQRNPVAGKIALLMGMPNSMLVLRCQSQGAIGGIFVNERLREICVSPVWGTPTTKTADLVPRIPIVSVSRGDGDELRALAEPGGLRAWIRTRTVLEWRPIPLLVGVIKGAVEPEKFVLLGGHHCSWYYGATDNATGNATMLEIARVLSEHRRELRRSVRVAFWPGHSQGRYSGSGWYADHFFEDLYDNCVTQITADSTGPRGATVFQARGTPDTRDFTVATTRDVLGVEPEASRMARAGDQSFWSIGIPSITSSSRMAPDKAADVGVVLFSGSGETKPKKKGSPPWWHTADDTLDKVDPALLKQSTQVYLLLTLRAAGAPIVPFRYGPSAEAIRVTLETYQAESEGCFDLGPAIERARQVEAAAGALDEVVDQARRRPDADRLAGIANPGLMALARRLVMVDFTSEGPFEQDLAVPIPPLALLEPVRRLKKLDPAASEARFLATELVRNRNKVMFYLREALAAAEATAAALRAAL